MNVAKGTIDGENVAARMPMAEMHPPTMVILRADQTAFTIPRNGPVRYDKLS